MRRFIALMLVLCMLVSTASAADSLKALSMEEQRIYLSNALSIQTSEHTYTTGGIYDWGWGWLDTYSSSSTSREWYPYRGPVEISKEEFYRLAGYDALADAEADAARTNKNMAIAGVTLSGVGLAAMLTSIFFTDNDALFLGLLGGGTLLTCIGIPLLTIQVSNDVSISFAVGIADSYNQRLLESF